jgi:hypothetical protein
MATKKSKPNDSAADVSIEARLWQMGTLTAERRHRVRQVAA